MSLYFLDLQMKHCCLGLHHTPSCASSHSHGGPPLVLPSYSLRPLGRATEIPWSVAPSPCEDLKATNGPSGTPPSILATCAFLFRGLSKEPSSSPTRKQGQLEAYGYRKKTNILMEFDTIQYPFRGGPECPLQLSSFLSLPGKAQLHTTVPSNSAQAPDL